MSGKKAAVGVLPSLRWGKTGAQAGRAVSYAAFSVLEGFIASRALIFGGLAPFGIAAVTAASGSDGVFTLLGAALGYVLPGGPQYGLRYVVACMAAFLFRWIFSAFRSITRSAVFLPGVAGVASLLTGMAVVISDGLVVSDVLLCLAEAAVCACSSVFFERAEPYLRHPSRIWGVGRQELISLGVAVCVVLLALTGIGVSGVTLGRIAGVVLILVAAGCRREAGGSITGTALALCFTMAGRNTIDLVAGYAFGGLMAGIFSPAGRFGCTVAFVVANAAAAFSAGFSTRSVTGLYEVLIASVIFMLLPDRAVARLSMLFAPSAPADGRSREERITARLSTAARTLCEVSETVSAVGDRLRNLSAENVTGIYDRAADIACRRCGMRMYCWGTAYNDTMSALTGMTETLRLNSKLTRADVPKHFAGRCCRLGDLLGAVNRCYGEYVAHSRERNKNELLRGVLNEQFSGLSHFLRELGQDFTAPEHPAPESEKVRAALGGFGLSVQEAVCCVDGRGRMSVKAEIQRRGKMVISRSQMLREISRACGRKLEGPALVADDNRLRLSFLEKPRLTAAFGCFSIPKSGEKLCGDACDAFVDDAGRVLLILSDGMGCGGRAAVDSNFTVRMASSLLRSGFGYDSMVKLVNSAMILKSGDESFATLDITAVDLFSGEAEFRKAGAPPTYIRRSGRAERITLSSIPVGLLRGVEMERGSARLRRGDMVVMISDGALTGDDGWLIRSMEAYGGEPPDDYARALAQKAKEARSDGHEDDITVLVGVLE